MTTVAAIDCGTNSIRLLILRREDDQIIELVRETRLARLGQGVDATGQFHPDALARTFAICDDYATLLHDHGVAKARFVATSAARDASNRHLLLDGVYQRLGLEVEVISGEEEARLSAAGVLSGVSTRSPSLVVDIGGGSTELVLIDDGGQIRHACSLDIGAVRIRERFLHHDPPTLEEQNQARTYIGSLLDSSGIDFGCVVTGIGVAGTTTSVAAWLLELTEYSREAVHGQILSRDQIRQATRHWNSTTVAEIATEATMHPLRAGVIGAGALILDEISQRLNSGSILVSESDILDGIALALLT